MAECDVLIVGAGPAGAIAGIVAARAGARVRLIDRATFPRDKLCGDTLNPGTLSVLRRLGISAAIERVGLRIDGMVLTGERGVAVEGRYPSGVSGCAIVRRDLDWLLVQQAIAAGCQLDTGVAAQRVRVDERGTRREVSGVEVVAGGGTRTIAARVVIAADGRRSAIAFGLGAARHPVRPRRWAIGAYFENFVPIGVRPPAFASSSEPREGGVRPQAFAPSSEPRDGGVRPQGFALSSERQEDGVRPPGVALSSERREGGVRPRGSGGSLGEMHVRRNCYVGVAAVPGGLTNVCLVKPSGSADADLRDPSALLTRTLAGDPLLRDRAAEARLAGPPAVLGPLAVDVDPPALDGLILAGDAAGFIDPMTGDGLRFAIRGGELAALSALDALERGWDGLHARHAAARRREFAGKWRFNRAVRALVASPMAIDAATLGGRLVPRVFERIVTHAGDCGR